MKNSSERFVADNVDEYIASFPEDVIIALENLRKTIKATAPKAEELISYQIPGYKYHGPLIYFAAFKNHCSLFAIGKHILKIFEKELKPFKLSGTTIHFTPDNPLPASVVRKIVQLRMSENEARAAQKKSKARPAKKAAPKKSGDDAVVSFMDALDHPLKREIEAVRKIIKGANKKIAERIKWNAPSYYTNADIVTFNPRATQHVHLVFHHPTIVQIDSPLLEGDYKDRRMVYLKDMKEVKSKKKELERIMNELVVRVEQGG